MSRNKEALDILNKLAEKETQFFNGNIIFVSPVLKTSTAVTTRIENIEYIFTVSTKRDAGWYALRAINPKHARIIREANQEEIQGYQSIFRRKKLIAIQRNEDHWLALNVGTEEIVRLYLSDGIELFDYIDAIGNGQIFWFISINNRRDAIIIENLRESFRKEIRLPKVTGILPDEGKAYAIASSLREEALKTDTQRRLEKALQHGNAKLIDYKEHGDVIVVNWEFDGRKINSTVRKNDMTVTTAGICLDNQDQKFDLASLPSVYREKIRRHHSLAPYHGPERGGDDEYDD